MIKKCVICDKTIITIRKGNRLYCSQKCNSLAYHKKHFKSTIDNIKVCEYDLCQNTFIKGKGRQKFCSLKCHTAERRKNKGQWRFTGEIIKCKGCEKSFVKDRAKRVFCTIECSKVYIGQNYYDNNKEKFSIKSRESREKNHPYKKYKKKFCEDCGFFAKYSCQLDVDHVDGNHYNNDLSNLKTLCANCHRLKTYLNKEGAHRRKIRNIVKHAA